MTDTLPAPISDEPNLLSVIARAAADPAVDVMKMEALLRLQREIIADHAKAEFNAAFARLTNRIPHVAKNGTITIPGKGSIPFAKWEDINRAVQPLLQAEGFGISFTTRHENNGLVVVGYLEHREGHSKSAEMQVPPDTSGSGTGRNPLQALGSALSYGKRYVAEMLLNIVREGQDDDGSGGPVTTRRGRAPAGFRPQPLAPAPQIKPEPPAQPAERNLLDEAHESARAGTFALQRFWKSLHLPEKRDLCAALESDTKAGCPAQLKEIAAEADRKKANEPLPGIAPPQDEAERE